ncbi:flocculation protein FLO11-like [Zingiber officinale]|uniref:flocculation protein FLO11-like n=1 Tax=Zingiber officinale TaxID=94328 RepID=UPI001C4BA62C|nr:flocculation protein FLO11-like [Zingiber officinale]
MEDWRLNLTRLLSEDLLSYFRLSPPSPETPHSLAEVLNRALEILPLPISDLEILRRGRTILERRLLPHPGSTSVRAATQPTSRPAFPTSVPRSISATIPRPAAPSQSTATPSRGRGYDQVSSSARPVFRGTPRGSRRARSALNRAGRGYSGRGTMGSSAPASSRSHPRSDSSDSDSQPLLHRLCHGPGPTTQAFNPVPPTTEVPPSATVAGPGTTSTSTPPVPPAVSSDPYRGIPAASHSVPTPDVETSSPRDPPSDTTPTEHVLVPPPAPLGPVAGPS